MPSENIIIRNCEMRDGHGGVTIGSEISGGVRNVFAEQCQMDSPHLDRALRLKNNAMRGGVLEHIYMRDVTVGQVADAVLSVDFIYEEGATGTFTPGRARRRDAARHEPEEQVRALPARLRERADRGHARDRLHASTSVAKPDVRRARDGPGAPQREDERRHRRGVSDALSPDTRSRRRG